MINAHDLTWIILAGGQALRMQGQDKGLVHFQGRPLIEHSLQRLQPQLAGPICINANRNIEQYQQYACVIEDIWHDYPGPLAGIHAGLTAAKTPWVGFSPCDCPFIHHELVKRFCEQAQDDVCEALVAYDGERWQPAFLMLHHSALPLLDAYLARGERRLMGFIAQLNHQRVLFADEPRAFINMNSPQELQQYQ